MKKKVPALNILFITMIMSLGIITLSTIIIASLTLIIHNFKGNNIDGRIISMNVVREIMSTWNGIDSAIDYDCTRFNPASFNHLGLANTNH